MSEQLTIGYIAGSGHSGSTLTDLLLGSQPSIASFGELKTLQDIMAGRKSKGVCTCGAKLDECEVWAPVLRQIAAQGLTIEMNDPKHPDFLQFSEVMFSALQKETGADVIVESSKNKSRPKMFETSLKLKCKVVHVVRDGRAVAYSHFLKQRDLIERLEIWISQQKEIQRLFGDPSLNSDYMVVRYEDLVKNPEEVVLSIIDFLGGDADALPNLDWTSRVRHNLDGNGMRKNESSVIKYDDSYLKALSDTEWEQLTNFASKTLEEYGYSLERKQMLNF